MLKTTIEKFTQGKYIKLPSCVSRRYLCQPTTKTFVQEVCKQRTGNWKYLLHFHRSLTSETFIKNILSILKKSTL